jgi:hypothetical protein
MIVLIAAIFLAPVPKNNRERQIGFCALIAMLLLFDWMNV